MSRKRRLRPLILPLIRVARLLPIALAALLGACGHQQEAQTPPPTPEAGYVVLHTQAVPIEIELPGRTAAFEMADVRPQVSGLIQARLFTEGAVVHAGQTLYQIDPSLYRTAAAQARANLDSAQAAEVSARALAARYRPLARAQAVSAQDLANAEAAAKQAAASVAQNRAALQTATINLAFTRVPAPIGGRIGRSLSTTGALVTNGQAGALATIQRLDPMFVDMQQSSADLLTLRRSLAGGGTMVASAASVRLKLEDGSDYPQSGRVEFAEVVVDPTTGAVTLRARFPNSQGLLLPGMYVRARFSQATRRDAILAPQAGIARSPKGDATAMVVGPGNKAVQRMVTTDRTVGANWLVTGGLAAGDRLIVEGLSKIKPGQAVRPVAAGSAVAAVAAVAAAPKS